MAAALLPAYAIAILMSAGPDDGCPSPRQLADALSAHLPGMVLPLGHATGPTTLRLGVATDAAGAMRLDLSDPEGGPLLHRWLPVTEHAHAGDCPALAETAALIVDRYWHEVGYGVPIEKPNAPPKPPQPKAAPPPPKATPLLKPPPAPLPKAVPPPAVPPPEVPPPEADEAAPPPRPRALPEEQPPPKPKPPAEPLPPLRWSLGAGIGGIMTASGDRAGMVLLAVGLERPVFTRRFGLRLSAGGETGIAATFQTESAAKGSANIWQLPVRIGGYLPIVLGVGRLEPGIGVDLDLLAVTSMVGSTSERHLRVNPGIDAALGWAVPFPHNIYIRLLTEGVMSANFAVTTRNSTTIFTAPPFSFRLGIEFGLWFP